VACTISPEIVKAEGCRKPEYVGPRWQCNCEQALREKHQGEKSGEDTGMREALEVQLITVEALRGQKMDYRDLVG
jgi:hypothetical protein